MKDADEIAVLFLRLRLVAGEGSHLEYAGSGLGMKNAEREQTQNDGGSQQILGAVHLDLLCM
jgi:hypothetical protein